MTPDDLAARLPALPGVGLVVLHGSRARGDAGPGADWDIAVLTDGSADLAASWAALTLALGTNAVDVVDLERASALLRYRVARDGVLLAGEEAEFLAFRLDAVRFWCDVGPVVRAAQAQVLAGLGPRDVA